MLRQVNSPPFKVWIVGDASASHQAYKHELEVLVKRLGLGYCTQFLGTQQDIDGVLSGLNLLVLASVCHEAFGRVIIEAQAAGVPVVATHVSAIPEVVKHGETGLLVPPSQPHKMAQAWLGF